MKVNCTDRVVEINPVSLKPVKDKDEQRDQDLVIYSLI